MLRDKTAALKDSESNSTVTPEIIDGFFPAENANLVVDEAHATGLYMPRGRGVVALLGLVDWLAAWFPMLGKAPVGSGGASRSHRRTRPLVRDSTYQYVLLDGLVSTAMSLTKHFSQLHVSVDMCNFFHQCYYPHLPTSFDRLEDNRVKGTSSCPLFPFPFPLLMTLHFTFIP